MLLLKTRRAVIEWAGRAHAFPVKNAQGVDFAQHGPDAVGAQRVGWKVFFGFLEGHHLGVAVDGIDGFGHRLVELSKAHAELPPEAFGPPWYKRLWHEVVL